MAHKEPIPPQLRPPPDDCPSCGRVLVDVDDDGDRESEWVVRRNSQLIEVLQCPECLDGWSPYDPADDRREARKSRRWARRLGDKALKTERRPRP